MDNMTKMEREELVDRMTTSKNQIRTDKLSGVRVFEWNRTFETLFLMGKLNIETK